LTFQESRVEQKINLRDLFGAEPSEAIKERFGQEVIDQIAKRTKSGIGMSFSSSGAGFQTDLQRIPYSKSYKESQAFKAFGKRNNVNLTLTGDMLGLLEIKDIDDESITIGWSDSTENAKAFNHSVGDTLPKRPFFGVSNGELELLKTKFKDFVPKSESESEPTVSESFILGILRGISGQGND